MVVYWKQRQDVFFASVHTQMEIDGLNMLLEFKTRVDLYEDPKEDGGKSKLIKKGIIVKHQWDLEKVMHPEQVINRKGQVIKNKCRVFVEDYGVVIVEHSYEAICKLKQQHHSPANGAPIGFLKGLKTKK